MNIPVAIGVTVVAAFLLVRMRRAHTAAGAGVPAQTTQRPSSYRPDVGVIAVIVLVVGALLWFSLRYGATTSLTSFTGSASFVRTVVVFLAICAFGLYDQFRWRGRRDGTKYFYAFVLGTIVTWVLIAFKRAFFETGVGQDPFLMALGMTCVVVGWRFLFGPWSASIKATVLGTFILWVSYAILRFETGHELLATGIAAVIAIVPVIIWCKLFLQYHRTRIAIVVLAFFSGMLSTVPILFYSELTKRGIELNFFIFKIIPINFNASSHDFVTGSVPSGVTGIGSVVLGTLVTYLVVGIIEEGSKFWVLRKSGKDFFRSIDDVLQLSIIVALGFSFAENLVNPTYYVGFVNQYLLSPPSPMWGPLIGSVVGRGVLTTMVHIVSTAILGYFFGLAFFAGPLIREQFGRGTFHPVVGFIHRLLSIRSEDIYAETKMATGFVLAIIAHGLFDFVVSIGDVLPGNPSTIGQLLGSAPTSMLSNISITLLPSVLYIVGGFWLLTTLFQMKDDLKEFGQVAETKAYVS